MKRRNIISLILLGAFLATTLSSCTDLGEDPSNKEPAQQPETNIVLADKSTSSYKIVVPESAEEYETKAAKYLQDMLEKSTGATLPIVNDTSLSYNPSDKVISVGQTNIFDGCGMTVDTEELNYDGYKIKRYDNTVVISGAVPLGTLNGVYGFLSEEIDYEAYASNEFYYEEKETLYLNDFDLIDVPDFAARMSDNITGTQAEVLKVTKFEDCGTVPGHTHTFFQYAVKATHGDEHPEWFDHTQLQPCFSVERELHPEKGTIVDEFVRRSIQELIANPDALWVDISQNDGASFCTCENCVAAQAKYTTTGYMLRFVNAVVEGVEEWRLANCPERDVKYVTLAYAGTTTPPVIKSVENGEVTYQMIDESCRPHEKLYINFAPLNQCYSHAFNDENCPTNANFYGNLQAWRAITDRFAMYDYTTDYHAYVNFYNNYGAMKANMKLYKDMGVAFIRRQNASGSGNKSMDDLQDYLYAKLAWDVDLDMQALIDDFMVHYYKEAAPAMSDYLTFLRTNWATKELSAEKGDKSFCQRCYLMYNDYVASVDLYPKAVVEQSLAYIDQAFDLVSTMEDKALANVVYLRILKESVCARYVWLKNYTSYYIADKDTYYALLDEWQDDALYFGTIVRENYSLSQTVEDFKSKVS